MPIDTTLSSGTASSKTIQSKSPRCSHYHSGPTGRLSRCRRQARYQFALIEKGELIILLRCQMCRDELYADVERGVTFEIIDEVPIGMPVDNL